MTLSLHADDMINSKGTTKNLQINKQRNRKTSWKS